MHCEIIFKHFIQCGNQHCCEYSENLEIRSAQQHSCVASLFDFLHYSPTVDTLYTVNTLSHLNRSLSHFSFVIKSFSSIACTCGGIKLTIVYPADRFHPIIEMSHANHSPKKMSEIPCWHFPFVSVKKSCTPYFRTFRENYVIRSKQSALKTAPAHNITFIFHLNRNQSDGFVAVTGQSKSGDLI